MHVDRSLKAIYDQYSRCLSVPLPLHDSYMYALSTTHNCDPAPLRTVLPRAHYFSTHLVWTLWVALAYGRLLRARDNPQES